MNKLTTEQEYKIIADIRDGKYQQIGRGSSRIVFNLGNNIVAKIAVGRSALEQNRLETLNYCQDTDCICAKIYSYGKFIILMEKLQPISDQDGLFYYDKNKYSDRYDAMEQLGLNNIYCSACDLLGETEDNYQIGISQDGSYKLYDYGYKVNSETPNVSRFYFKNNKERNKYLNTLLSFLINDTNPNKIHF